jgi:hypothetical protein
MPIPNGLAAGISQLAWPSEAKYSDLPTQRMLWLEKLVNYKPSEAPHFALRDGSGRYSIATGTLYVNFENRQLHITDIPCVD